MSRTFLAVCFAITGCVMSPKPAAKSAAGSGSGSGSDAMVCKEVTPTGSLISHTECEKRSQKEEERHQAQRWMSRPRNTMSPAQGGK